MKVTCPACNASYRLPDEKIQGKNRIFKISCKRCSAEIRVRGVETEEEIGRTTMPFALEMPVPVAVQAPTPVWFAGIEGRQVGPLTESEIVDHIHQGRLTAQDLVWRKGFSAWLPAREVAPFDELVVDVAEHAATTAKKPRRAQTLELSAAMIELLVKLDGQSEQAGDNAAPVAAAEPPALPALDDDAEGMPPVPTETRTADRAPAIAGNLAAVAAAEQVAETTIAPMPDDVIVQLPPRTPNAAAKKDGQAKTETAAKAEADAPKVALATPTVAAAEPALAAAAQLEIKKSDVVSGKKPELQKKSDPAQRPDTGKKPELAKVEKINQVEKNAGEAAPSIKIRLPDSGVQPAENAASADSIPTDKGKRPREDAATNVNLPNVADDPRPQTLPSLAQPAATPLGAMPMVKPQSSTMRPSPTIGKPQIAPGPITTQSKPSLSKTEPPRAATAKPGDRKSDAAKVGAKKGNGMFLLLGGGVAVVAFAVIAVLATGGKKSEKSSDSVAAAPSAPVAAPAAVVDTADVAVAAAAPIDAQPDVQVAVATADVQAIAPDAQVAVAPPVAEQQPAVDDKAVAVADKAAAAPAADKEAPVVVKEDEAKKAAEKKEAADKKEEKKEEKKADKKEEKAKEEKKPEVKEEKKDSKAEKKAAAKDDLEDLVGKGKKEKKVEEPKVKEEPPPEKKKSRAGDDDEIDRILNRQKEKGGAKKAADEEDAGGLSADQVKAVGAKAGQKVIRCYMLNADADGSEETIKVNVFVAPDGSVTNAKVAGKYASGPLGKCISDAVKALTFPAGGGGTKKYTLTYKAGG